MKKYKLQEIIGDGTYGTVWKGTLTETGELVAIKKLKNKIKSWNECIEMKEVKVLSKLKSHSNIIKLKEIIRETNSEVYMIFEYAELNLFQYMEKIKKR
jgi:male germ cell-associated kinase